MKTSGLKKRCGSFKHNNISPIMTNYFTINY